MAEPSPSYSPSRRDHLRKAATSLLTRWADPVVFAKEALGVTVSPDQEKILRAPCSHIRTACRSGQKTGKSRALGILGLWWPLVVPNGRVAMTAPSYHQIRNILWPEVRRLYYGAKFGIGGQIAIDPASGLRLPGDRGIICISTDKPEKVAGLSGENILILVDEGSGYPDELWEPLFGNMAGGGRLLTTGNPTRTSGPFFDAFASPEFWHPLHVSSENTPNVLEGRSVIPGLATREWVDERKKEWGEESAAYQVRVRGNFPTQAENAVIPLTFAQAAQEREAQDEGVLNLGVDVARFGDDETIIQPRRGLKAYPPIALQGADTIKVVGEVVRVAREQRRANEKVRCKVDEIGVGAGVVDLLKSQHGADIEVLAVNVAEKATAEGFTKLRDQIWFCCRDWLKSGGSIPDDPKLFSELIAPTYTFDAQGRQKVESKDEIKKRLRRSPDRADALCLSIYEAPTIDVSDWVV